MTTGTITADAAGTWHIGDLPVNRVGFGAMRLTGSAAFHLGTPSDRGRSIAVLRRAIELGVNHLDTAAFYFSALRSANELINSALSPYPDDLLIATKVGPFRDYRGSGAPRPVPRTCAAMSRRTCASSAATTSTSSTCAGCARSRSPSTSAPWPICARRA